MNGTTGRAPGGNFIVAMNAQAGAEPRRFNTIARPGDPGGSSLNALSASQRDGASVWVPASYDQTLDLAFFGPAQTYDTEPLHIPSDAEGITNDALYTDSTLAMYVTTGKLVGALATAGGVVFAGALDRSLIAYDDMPSKELWRTCLGDVPSDAPISYAVNGRQYLSVVVGNGGAPAHTFPALVPEIRNPLERGAAVFVFEMPDRSLR
ncbi:MAG: hypothetical protein ABJA98_11585 [Acidobacteriota bacterium]